MNPEYLNAGNLGKAYDGWFYTILGCGGSLDDWMNGYQELFDKEEIGTVEQWYKTTGKEINDCYSLEGNNRFADDLTVLMFSYGGMNVGNLALFKLKMGDRWFTDIIDNSCPKKINEEEEEE